MRLKSPGRGDRAVLIIADLLSPLRGSACSLSAVIPRLAAVGHILAPLMRLGVGRRAYSSAYALGERVSRDGAFTSHRGTGEGFLLSFTVRANSNSKTPGFESSAICRFSDPKPFAI
jgi:hypothetical protein